MHKNITKYLLFLAFGLFLGQNVYAQLPPDQPEQDCFNALAICQYTYTQNQSYQGDGALDAELPGTSCLLSDEKNDTWYIFTAQTSGDVCFTITPVNGGDDYDWAVYNLTGLNCADIGTGVAPEVGCNYSGNIGCGGATGPNGLNTQAGYPCPGQNESCIPVTAGETYVVNVSNFSTTPSGYTIDFGASSASIFDNIPPQLQPLSAACGQIQVAFSENVLCNTVSAGDFTVTGPAGNYTVTNVIGTNCLNGGTFETSFTLSLFPAPGTGNYTITIAGTVTDNCGNPCPIGSSINVSISAINASAFANPNPVCPGQPVVLSTNYSALPGYTYNWTPGNLPGPNPVVNPAATTVYSVTVTDPNNCVGTANVTVNTADILTSPAIAAPTNICVGDTGSVVYVGSPAVNFLWTFDGGIVTNGATGQGPYTLSWNTPSPPPQQICVFTSLPGCSVSSACVNVNVMPPPIPAIAPISDQCLNGNSFLFSYVGDTGINNIYWGFGPSAVPQYSSALIPPAVHYVNPGPKQIWAVVTRNGCVSDTAYMAFNVLEEPDAQFTTNSQAVCQGSCMSFTYSGIPITNILQQTYSWDFGPDATPQFSTLSVEPCVIFANPGPHPVKLIVTNQGLCVDSTVQIITIHENPQIYAGPDGEFCDGTGGVVLNSVPTGGTAPYGYNWNCNTPGACGITPNPYSQSINANPTTSPVTYYIQISDVFGCLSNIDSALVTINEKPKVNAGRDTFVCGPPTSFGVYLNGMVTNNPASPGPYSYTWTPNSGMGPGQDTLPNPYVHPNTTTTYVLTVTDSKGCNSILTTLDSLSTITVSVRPIPLVNAGLDTAICFKDIIQMNGFAANAGPTYTYTWSPSDPNSGIVNASNPLTNVSPHFTTTFTLTATSNGCSASDNMNIVVHTLPTTSIDPPIADICQGDSVKLTGLANGDLTGLLYTYSWASSAGLGSPLSAITMASPNTTTTYTLYVATSECPSDVVDNITVQVKPTPHATITNADTLICYGDTVKLHSLYNFNGSGVGSPILFNWTPFSAIDNIYTQDVTVYPTQSTTYVISISVAGECARKDSVRIDVTPDIGATATADTTTICGAGTVTLHASGGLGNPIYTWSNGQYLNDSTILHPIATLLDSAQFILTIKEGFCVDKDTIFINVHPQPESDYIGTHKRGCVPLEVNFWQTAKNAIAYYWDFGDNSVPNNTQNPTHVYTQVGTFPVSLLIMGEGGCLSNMVVDSVQVSDTTFAGFISNPTVGDTIYAPDAVVTFTDTSKNAVSWVWDFGDGKTSSSQVTSHAYQNPGDYTVMLTVTNEDGCVSHEIKYPYVVANPALSVPNVFSPNGDNIHDTWEVSYLGHEAFNVTVYDRWGELLFTSDTTDKKWDGRNKKGYAMNSGVYFYAIRVGEKEYTGNVTLLK